MTPNDEDEFERELAELELGPEDLQQAAQEHDIAALEQRAQLMAEGEALVPEQATDRVWQIDCGKDSGLSWWLGSDRKLRPEMPVMSPEQVGACSPADQGGICAALANLWRQWAPEMPTRAEALVAWVGEALDTTAQMQAVVDARGGRWIASDAPWPETRAAGSRRSHEPRTVFREDLPDEIVAWFETRGAQYRTTTGDPAPWEDAEPPKATGDLAPDWYQDADPVYDLPYDERGELLDWIAALTGALPAGREGRFSPPDGGQRASRREVAEVVQALCTMDEQIDRIQQDARDEIADTGRSQLPTNVFEAKSIEQVRPSVYPVLSSLQEQARRAVSHATRVSDFDAFGRIRARVKAPGKTNRERFYLALVSELFGPEAAADETIQLVAKCGKTPLSQFRDLLRIEGDTIVHSPEFKELFAEQHRVHSECVARRIARQLWEYKLGREKGKQYAERPNMMYTLVRVMQAFKVPCSASEERELRSILRRMGVSETEPEELYGEYRRRRRAIRASELSEYEREAEELSEQYAEAERREFAAQVFGGSYEKNAGPRVPTPVDLMAALM